ncbi:hypothetical protein FRC12_001140 [Ceratobasidium sp. 428]|nr:hypothetical protein FRC12_001140 [Ceratobasidium sp. 428]
MAMFDTSMTALHGWHRGETALQTLLNLKDQVQFDYTLVRDHMPDQHRIFHTSNIAFVPITTLDSTGRPWVSLLSSTSGTTGFITGPSEVELKIEADVWEGDPILRNLEGGLKVGFLEDGPLLAGLGIEWASRRRNKFAGKFYEVKLSGRHLSLGLQVTQTIGNCPKYISIRTVGPSPTNPQLAYDYTTVSDDARLPDEVVKFIHKADTVFIGTSYVAKPDESSLYPSHLGTNHRGGRAGFVRVRNDGRTIVLPDYSGECSFYSDNDEGILSSYSGNRFMQSLGNVQATPLAAITILDFETGDILYVTGTAQNLIGKDAESVMPRSNLITLISLTGYTFVRNAMPVRQVPGSPVVPSPYSPPVRYLAEEKPSTSSSSDVSLTLSRIQIHSHDLATFTFIPSAPVSIRPGQAAIIDASSFTGRRGYQHMSRKGDESSLNDDGIRTWTVSGRGIPGDDSSAIMITMREKPGGFVTSRLFDITRTMPGLLEDTSPLQLVLPLVGIDGDFVLPTHEVGGPAEPRRLLWAAGGVGITPFLSMLRGIMRQGGSWDIVILIAARRGDAEVLGKLVEAALRLDSNAATPPTLSLHVQVYSKGSRTDIQPNFGRLPDGSLVDVTMYGERLTKDDLLAKEADVVGREVFVCGPLPMEELVLQGAREVGVGSELLHRENFAY